MSMRRVTIPADRREMLIDVLGRGIRDPDVLVPVVEQLRSAVEENGQVSLLITDEQCTTASAVTAVYADNFFKKLSLLFDDAVEEPEPEVPRA